MDLILALKKMLGDISIEDMRMIADINRIRLNLKFINKLLKENADDME